MFNIVSVDFITKIEYWQSSKSKKGLCHFRKCKIYANYCDLSGEILIFFYKVETFCNVYPCIGRLYYKDRMLAI